MNGYVKNMNGKVIHFISKEGPVWRYETREEVLLNELEKNMENNRREVMSETGFEYEISRCCGARITKDGVFCGDCGSNV